MENESLIVDILTGMMKSAERNRVRTSKLLEEIVDFEMWLSEKNILNHGEFQTLFTQALKTA